MSSLQSPRVFLSYSREDSDFARALCRDLRSAEVSVWTDEEELQTGSQWDRAIQDALERCTCLLVVLSPASISSDNVLDEISFAIDKGTGASFGRVKYLAKGSLLTDSKITRMLQLADFVSYAVFKNYGRSDAQFFNTILKRFIRRAENCTDCFT